MIQNSALWAGSEHSFQGIDLAMRQLGQNPPDVNVIKMYDDDDEDERNPVTIDRVGSLAILNISGAMMAKSSWMTRYLGIPTYQDIRSQLTRVAQSDAVNGIMLNIDSNGGLVEGCFSLCRFVRQINDKLKPVVSFTDARAHSAAFAIMVSGSKKLASEDASLGSVGCIAVHAEMTKMFEEMGVKHTVFRSAPYKALGQREEKLTDEAKAEFQKEIMMAHNKFETHIYTMTGVDKNKIHTEIADGRTFTASEGKKKEMVDSVVTLEEAVGKLSAALDKQRPAKAVIPQSR